MAGLTMTRHEMIELLGWRYQDMTEAQQDILSRAEHIVYLAALREREACAVYLERGIDLGGLAGHPGWQNYTADLLAGCAAAIRARGQQ